MKFYPPQIMRTPCHGSIHPPPTCTICLNHVQVSPAASTHIYSRPLGLKMRTIPCDSDRFGCVICNTLSVSKGSPELLFRANTRATLWDPYGDMSQVFVEVPVYQSLPPRCFRVYQSIQCYTMICGNKWFDDGE